MVENGGFVSGLVTIVSDDGQFGSGREIRRILTATLGRCELT